MLAALSDVDGHAGLESQLHEVGLVDVLEVRCQLHAKAAHLGGARVNLAVFAQGGVGLAGVAVTGVGVDVGQLAADGAAADVEGGFVEQGCRAGRRAEDDTFPPGGLAGKKRKRKQR